MKEDKFLGSIFNRKKQEVRVYQSDIIAIHNISPVPTLVYSDVIEVDDEPLDTIASSCAAVQLATNNMFS